MLALGIIRPAKEIGIARNSWEGVEFHMKYTRHLLPTPAGPLQRRKRIINRSPPRSPRERRSAPEPSLPPPGPVFLLLSLLCSPPPFFLSSSFFSPHHSSSHSRPERGSEIKKGPGRGKEVESDGTAAAACAAARRPLCTIWFIILLGFSGNIGVIYDPS